MIQAIHKSDSVTQVPDFIIANLGSIVAFTPMTATAREACEDGTIVFEDWQVMGGSIMVEHRCAADLVENLRGDGFVVADE